jgi:hypothetical protein
LRFGNGYVNKRIATLCRTSAELSAGAVDAYPDVPGF